MSPAVSVIMPVYNGEKYLAAAVESILNQTFSDFEFIIINDGSTDKTAQILGGYTDKRIRIIKQTNQGIVRALNRGIKEAKGKYVARFDSDDISAPERLTKEIEFLEAHSDYVLVGSASTAINEAGEALLTHARLTDDEDIKQELYCANPFGHGTVLARLDAIKTAGGYSGEYSHTEDYDLWRRLAKIGKLGNLPQVLYDWRINLEGVSQQNTQTQIKNSSKIQEELWQASPPLPQNIKHVLAQSGFYKKIPRLGAQLHKHYLLTQLRLAKVFGRHNHWDQAAKLTLAVILSGPTGWKVLLKLLPENIRKLYWRMGHALKRN